MKLQKILRSYSGFSMVEITVAMGLLGLATVAVMNLSENVTTSTKRAETMLSKSQFASALGGYLYSATACEEMKTMNNFSGSNAQAMVLKEWKVAGLDTGEILKDIKAGKQFKNFKLKSLDAVMDNSAGLPQITIGSTPYKKTFLNVKAVLEVKQNKDNLRDYEYFFNIPVLATMGGKVHSCAEEKSAQETCSAMRGVFDPITKKCNLGETCKMQGTFAKCTGGTCPGTPNVNNQFTSSTRCPSSAQELVTGNRQWQHTGTCSGKKCTPPQIQNTFTYFSCLECPGVTPTSSSAPSTTGSYGGGGGGGGCFVAGTQIELFGGGTKNIEDVKVGDRLVDHRGSEVIVQALKSYEYEGKIYSVNGSGYFFTPNHPFLTVTGWKSLDPKESMKESPGLVVSNLKVGDILLKKSGSEKIKTLDSRVVKEKVYNFTVSDSHEYIADEFVVHNIKQMDQLEMQHQ